MYDHKKQLRWSSLRVGIVLTSALIVLILTIIFAGSIERFFSKKEVIYAEFNDVRGLREGAPVWFSGIEIGSVGSMNFTSAQRVRVTLIIKEDALKYLKKDSEATVLTLGLLGDKYIELSPGTETAQEAKPGDVLTGKTVIELQDIVKTSQKSIERISEFVSMLESLLVKIEKGEGSLARFLKDPTVYENLKKSTRDLSVIVSNLKSGKGSLGKLLTDDKLYTNLETASAEITSFAAKLNSEDNTIGRLLKNPELYDRLLSTTVSIETFTKNLESSRGSLKKFIDDDALYNNLESLTGKLDKILGRIESGEGTLGKLTTENEISNELKETLSELSKLVKDIKEHPGRYFKFSIF